MKSSSAASSRRTPRRVPFVGHEIAEYVVALALMASGLHSSGRLEYELVATGGAMLLLGIISSGPLGALAVLSRRLHHLGDLVIAAGLAISPFVFPRDRGTAAIVVAELLAAGLIWIARATRYIDLPRAPRRSSIAGAMARNTGSNAASGQFAPAAGRAARLGARRLGLIAGVTRRTARNYKSQRGSGETR